MCEGARRAGPSPLLVLLALLLPVVLVIILADRRQGLYERARDDICAVC